MLYLRSLVFTAVMILATMVWSFACVLFAPLPYAQRYWWTMRWSWFCILMLRWICGVRHRVIGAENLPDSPVILLSKHQSAWETIFYPVYMPHPLVYVFKRELLFIPFFGWGIGLLRMIAIDRRRGANAFEQVVSQGKRRLADGQWVIMFPEGTRTKRGSKGHYKTGGTRLALRTQTPVVPIAVNSADCWPRNSFIKTPGVITVSIGAPIAPEGHTPESLMTAVETWIETEMRRLSPAAYTSPASSEAPNLQKVSNVNDAPDASGTRNR